MPKNGEEQHLFHTEHSWERERKRERECSISWEKERESVPFHVSIKLSGLLLQKKAIAQKCIYTRIRIETKKYNNHDGYGDKIKIYQSDWKDCKKLQDKSLRSHINT